MRTDFFYPGQRVVYIPNHANGDLHHKDVEPGTVSSRNEHNVFVKFDKQLRKFGWDGTTSQSCTPSTLQPIRDTWEAIDGLHPPEGAK